MLGLEGFTAYTVEVDLWATFEISLPFPLFITKQLKIFYIHCCFHDFIAVTLERLQLPEEAGAGKEGGGVEPVLLS